MGTNNVLNQLTFSENSPVKTMLLQQEHFGLVRIALGKGVKIPPHQGGHAVFFWFCKAGEFSLAGKRTSSWHRINTCTSRRTIPVGYRHWKTW
jgi:hypothetical protein